MQCDPNPNVDFVQQLRRHASRLDRSQLPHADAVADLREAANLLDEAFVELEEADDERDRALARARELERLGRVQRIDVCEFPIDDPEFPDVTACCNPEVALVALVLTDSTDPAELEVRQFCAEHGALLRDLDPSSPEAEGLQGWAPTAVAWLEVNLAPVAGIDGDPRPSWHPFECLCARKPKGGAAHTAPGCPLYDPSKLYEVASSLGRAMAPGRPHVDASGVELRLHDPVQVPHGAGLDVGAHRSLHTSDPVCEPRNGELLELFADGSCVVGYRPSAGRGDVWSGLSSWIYLALTRALTSCGHPCYADGHCAFNDCPNYAGACPRHAASGSGGATCSRIPS